jgi:PhoH-like ATPase
MSKKPGTPRKQKTRKLFVLDTNVLMHDPTSLFRFDEHDVYLPIATLEELDAHKRGLSDVSRNARQASRFLDEIVSGSADDIKKGLELRTKDGQQSGGRLYLQTEAINGSLPQASPQARTTTRSSQVVNFLQEREEQRGKQEKEPSARSCWCRKTSTCASRRARSACRGGLLQRQGARGRRPALHRRAAPAEGLLGQPRQGHGVVEEGRPHLLPRARAAGAEAARERVRLRRVRRAPALRAGEGGAGRMAVLETLRDYTHAKNSVWGITARNREQNFALNLLMNPAVDFVTLLGQAGTGKTLLALAAGLTQVLDDKRYSEIIMTRVTVPLGEDIGFLPGTEEEKMQPWMGALEDNLDVLNASDESGGEWGRAATRDLVRSRIKIKSLNFMRGRTVRQQVAHHRRGAEPHAQADEDARHARGPAPR